MDGGGFIVEPESQPESSQPGHRSYNQFDRNPEPPQSTTAPVVPFISLSGCSKCNSLSFSEEFRKAFGVLLCNACSRQPEAKLISKSAAKTQYFLADGDFKTLGYVRRKNPHKRDWQPMKLYMESQIREIAFAKHGGEDGIEAKARQLLDNKLQTRLNKREQERQKEERHEARRKRIKQRIEEDLQKPVEQAELSEEDVEEI